jgi:hypothetical protein
VTEYHVRQNGPATETQGVPQTASRQERPHAPGKTHEQKTNLQLFLERHDKQLFNEKRVYLIRAGHLETTHQYSCGKSQIDRRNLDNFSAAKHSVVFVFGGTTPADIVKFGLLGCACHNVKTQTIA